MLACWGSTLSALTEVLLSVSSSRASSPADVFRAESVTHINKENEQFVRDYHPSLSSQRSLCSESLFGLSVLPSPHPKVCMPAVDQSTTSPEINS